MASKLKELRRKSWGSVKNKLKSLFIVPPTEEDFNVSFSPPTVVRLEESVFFADFGDSVSSLGSTSSTDTFPIYIHRTTSQISQIKPKGILKSKIRHSPSAPALGQLTPAPSVPDLTPDSPESSTLSCLTPSPSSKRSLRRCPQMPFDSSRSLPSTKVFRFSETVVVYETYNNDHYKRESAESPEFTLKQIEKINKEIRRFKLGEMKVHPDSINNMSLTI